MARTGLNRPDVRRAHDPLLARGQHPSIDVICIVLGDMGSKMVTHRYLKESEEEEGMALKQAGTISDAVLSLAGRLAARLHEEEQVAVDQQVAAVTV